MKIYKNRIPLFNFDQFIKHKDDHYFLRLTGINIESDDVQPIYIPLFSFARRAGQVILELMGWQTRHIITIILQSAKPYFWIGHTDQVVMEEDDEY